MVLVRLPKEVIYEVRQLCLQSPREEVCGVVDSKDGIHPVRNASQRPDSSFVFDKLEYFNVLKKLKAQQLTVKAIYHTHPDGDATPSKADLEYVESSRLCSLIVSPVDYKVLVYEAPHAHLY